MNEEDDIDKAIAQAMIDAKESRLRFLNHQYERKLKEEEQENLNLGDIDFRLKRIESMLRAVIDLMREGKNG